MQGALGSCAIYGDLRQTLSPAHLAIRTSAPQLSERRPWGSWLGWRPFLSQVGYVSPRGGGDRGTETVVAFCTGHGVSSGDCVVPVGCKQAAVCQPGSGFQIWAAPGQGRGSGRRSELASVLAAVSSVALCPFPVPVVPFPAEEVGLGPQQPAEWAFGLRPEIPGEMAPQDVAVSKLSPLQWLSLGPCSSWGCRGVSGPQQCGDSVHTRSLIPRRNPWAA